MQRKQEAAKARRKEAIDNIAPRQLPPMVTRLELFDYDRDTQRPRVAGYGILKHPPRFAR